MATILVVDDNQDMGEVISEVLREEGYNVNVAYDGLSALNAIKNQPYDFMILDYKLSDMDGLAVLEAASRLTPSLATIMISAYGNEAIKSNARELGALDFFDKPFDVNALVKSIKKTLGKRSQTLERFA
jgi:DNA-binding NtrC family response regulator